MTPTSTLRRLGLGVAALAFTAGGLSACGGDEETVTSDAASDSASSAAPDAGSSSDAAGGSDLGEESSASAEAGGADVAEFCGAYADYFQELSGVASPEDIDVATIKDFSERLSEIGLPDDAPDNVRNGFEVSVQAAASLPDDADQSDLAQLQSSISTEDQADAQAFGQYVVQTCPDLMSSLGGGTSPSAG